jgi:Caspase domain
MPRIHALLVGINDYANISKLHGCVADISAVHALLTSRVPAASLNAKVLLDGAATRAAIIDGFRSHLRAAADGDIALFYFCGHGSQERCPAEWRVIEPSGMNQTIVPVDARANDVFDIADKELAALISEVASGGAQVVVMFDSCHSGGVTREADESDATHANDNSAGVARMTPSSTGRARTLADYLDATRELYAPELLATTGPPDPKHIAIMACQHDQLAKEFPKHPTPRRGAFTQAFEESVASLGSSATYADLVTAIRTKVRDRATDQMPSLAAIGGANAAAVFLAGQIGRSDLTVDADAAGAWWLSAGAVTGVPATDAGAITTVTIYARGAFDAGASAPTPLATARLDLVQADRSRLMFSTPPAALVATTQYLGVITGMGSTPLVVVVTGTPAEKLASVKTTLGAQAGVFAVAEAPSSTIPSVTVRVEGNAATIIGTDGVALANQSFVLTTDGVAALTNACVHLATWHGIRDRTPLASTLNDKVTIEVIPVAAGETSVPADRPPLVPNNGALALQYIDGKPPRVQFRLRNTASVPLFVAFVDLSDSFGCALKLSEKLEPGQVAFSDGGKINGMAIAKWRDPSFFVTTDLMKVFAATESFTTSHLVLPSLLNPNAGGTREAVEEEEPDASFWGTTTLRIETSRQALAAS